MPRTSEFTKLSSHVIGSDHVGRKADVQPDLPLEGIYGSNGFYFQQRRGRLDLRSLAQIDLEKVVRDVDIDVLQMSLENICFCNLREEDLRFITDQHVVKIFRASQLVIEYLLYAQEQLADNCNLLSNKYSAKKRSVMKKRKELMELQENSKVMRAQLRSKKKNIKTLEQLLKDASHNKRRKDDVTQPSPTPTPTPKQRLSILRFFVSNSNGLCVEFNLRPNTFVYELLKEVKQAFVSRRDREDYNSSSSKKNNKDEIQLIYQGKVLLEGNTLEEVDVQSNDTIIAVIPSLRDQSDEVREDKEHNKHASDNDEDKRRREELERQKQMMDFFAQQQEMMKENWGLLVGKLSEKFNMPVADNKHDPLAQRELEAKIASMESAIHHQMRAEFDQMRESIGSMSHKSRFIVGELEDDDDEHQRELERKIKLSNQRLRELEGKLEESDYTVSELRKLQRAQAEELEELRRLIRESDRQPIVQQQPVPVSVSVPAKRSVDSGGRKEPKTHSGKWNQFALAGKSAEPVTQQHSSSPVVEEVVEVKQPPPLVAKEKPQTPKMKLKSPPPAKVRRPVSPPQKDVRLVAVTFPEERMTHLSQVVGLWGEAVELTVLEDISPDDLIFEIRRVVAEKAKIPLARVSLSVQGTDVFLAIDLPTGVQLTATSAPGLIQQGDLVVEVRNPITDAQLDSLGAQLDNDSDQNEYLSGGVEGGGRNFNKSLDMNMSLRRSMASNSESDTEKVYSDTLRQYNQSNKSSSQRRRNYDSDSDSEDSEGELEEDSVMNHYRNSLSSTLVGLDDMKGLTDDELESKMTHLKSSMEGLPPKVSKNLSGYRGTVPGTVSAAIDSGSEDFSASDNDGNSFRRSRDRSDSAGMHREKSLRLAPEGLAGMTTKSFGNTVGGQLEGIGLRRKGKGKENDTSERRLFSSSLTLSRGSDGGMGGGGGRKLRDYDSQDDGDGDSDPVLSSSQNNGDGNSNRNSRGGYIPRKASPQTRYSSMRDSDDNDHSNDDNADGDDDDDEGNDRLAQEYLKQYEREDQSQHQHQHQGGGDVDQDEDLDDDRDERGGLNSSMLSSGTAEEKREYLSSVSSRATTAAATTAANRDRDTGRDRGRMGMGMGEGKHDDSSSRGSVEDLDQDRDQTQEPTDFDDTSSLGSATPRYQQQQQQQRLSPSDLRADSTGGSFSLSQQSFVTDDSDGEGGGRGGGGGGGRDDHRLLLNSTVDTDISMPEETAGGDNYTHSFDREDSVNRRADQYERDVDRTRDTPASSTKPPLDSSASGLHTPNSSARRNNNNNSNSNNNNNYNQQQQLYNSKNSNDTSSPFDHLTSDFDDDNDVDMLEGSLDLSQSADAFGSHGTNLELSSFSNNNR